MDVSFNCIDVRAIFAAHRVKLWGKTGDSPHTHEEFIGPSRARLYVYHVEECHRRVHLHAWRDH